MFWFGVQTANGGTCVSAVGHSVGTLVLVHLLMFVTDSNGHVAQFPAPSQPSARVRWPHHGRNGVLLLVLAHPIPVSAYPYS